jgi:4-hydroxy-3-polyprenylbenzoate decarboxylase
LIPVGRGFSRASDAELELRATGFAMFKDLNDFISALDSERELARVTDPVSPDLEICAVTDRASKSPGGGPALLFEHPTGFDVPVAINLFGSMKRICMALGVKRLDDLAHEIDELATPKMPGGIVDALKMLPMVNRLRDLMPKTVTSAPCQEVVLQPGSLESIPILKCWPEDGGRYITFPLVFTKDPETGARNIGTYRMQVFDAQTTAMHWQQHKGGAQHYRVAERLGERLPVAVALGPDPALAYSATAPMPEGLDELMLAGFLRRERVELVKCVSVALEVPANAQIVLEGYVEPGERRREGPFGDHTGFYSHPDDYPVFHVTCVTSRKRPVYLTTVVGIPPMEDYYLGKASERIFLPLIRKTVPEIVDMHFPAAGIFHNLVIVSIDKRYPGHARKIMNAFWGLGQLMFSKTIIVVDKDVDVQNEAEVAWVVGTHYDPERDIQFTRGPVDDLDDASDLHAYGSKMGIDATRKWPTEGFTRPWPKKISMTADATRNAERLWHKISKGWKAGV